uniref:Tryptophan synthase beta chain-like PALP domain-containing protein n=1 Tax=Pseudo-nitzschia australis TaxID=44445 RepID=A0A7S4AAI2_9STRA|mmetsp:Transcript_17159/g.37534  ORF Transcript_17159/g.37534 Transcript_17159/m.37534 type:complete len:374 (+) Transcript_17159:324-1445(+)
MSEKTNPLSSSSSPQNYCISFDDVKKAADRIRGVAHRTPVMTCRSLIASSEYDDGKNYFFKIEAMQKTGSFKFRGALNAVKNRLEINGSIEDKDKPSSSNLSVVTHSSGNHAQALALASKMASNSNTTVAATIVMPITAPLVKKNAVKDFGADIVVVENTNEARKEEAERIVESTGAVFIHPSEDPNVIAGQGTVCLEFVEQVRDLLNGDSDLDAVIIPVGGGGLASGNCISLRALLGEKLKIILAEPDQLDDAKRSFTEGRLLKHRTDNKLDSVADGLKTTLGPNTWPIIKESVDDIITVSEEEILRATRLVWERLKVAIEPSAGVGVAVAQSLEFNTKYKKSSGINNVGIILCGGNVDIIKIASKMKEISM